MNKDPLKEPRSDALKPSWSKEGDALFIAGGFRWIKRCSWWEWHVESALPRVCRRASVWLLWRIWVQEPTRVCVAAQWGSAPSPLSCSVSAREPNCRGNRRRLYLFIYFPIRHFTSSLMNVFIGYVMRTSYGWLVELFNFINLGWNLLCKPKLM